MSNRVMVFHHPLPIKANASSASQIRPFKIRQAFIDLGFQVLDVTGYSKERAQAIRKIKQETQKGLKIDFLYSEFSTSPLATNDPHNLPLRPFMDYSFFKWFQQHHGKVGVFYRDVHWAFPFYKKSLSPLKFQVALGLYKYDLHQLRDIDQLFVPSQAMINYLPKELVDKKPTVSPPGTQPLVVPRRDHQQKLLYAGGLGGSIYDVNELLHSISQHQDFDLTLLVRKYDWENLVRVDDFQKPNNLHLSFKNSEESAEEFLRSDFFAMMIEPNEYFNMAMPMKLFDAISFELPLFCRKGSESARFIETHQIGWAVESTEAMVQLLKSEGFVDAANRCRDNLKRIKEQNTWVQRAQTITDKLSFNS